ncbi:3564_t:CDS:2 [Paraglomus occultum]|uniref:ATP synthase subunit 4 n=1 Tax=Paraglomus occultum TaxID=144539 RepID=A0A9N9A4Q1_9GLOM|nr:3564_t:CDS:2 [Paraglomus occultum]
MALRQLSTRCLSGVNGPLLNVLGRPAINLGIRRYSTPASEETPVDPKQKALSIIDALPGNSVISKTGYITLGTGLATYVLSKELYVFNEETLVVVSFAAMALLLYRGIKKPFNDWATEENERVNGILRQARADHKAAVEDRIETVGQLGDIVDVTKALFAMSKETATLEAEAFELKQNVAAAAEIKSVLDSWVRYEAAIREREQKALAEAVIEKVKAAISDPKVQQQILEESLAETERIIGAKTA